MSFPICLNNDKNKHAPTEIEKYLKYIQRSSVRAIILKKGDFGKGMLRWVRVRGLRCQTIWLADLPFCSTNRIILPPDAFQVVRFCCFPIFSFFGSEETDFVRHWYCVALVTVWREKCWGLSKSLSGSAQLLFLLLLLLCSNRFF